MNKKCLVKSCKNKGIIKDMCHIHGILRYKLTKYYHKIGDPLLIESYKNIKKDEEIYNYTQEELENYIKKLRFIWSEWRKCLLARKELTYLCFSDMDYGHSYFINEIIIPNMNTIEKKLEICYLLMSKYRENNKLIIEEEKIVDDSNIKNIKTNKIKKIKKVDKKINNKSLKSNSNDNSSILNKSINPNLILLSETKSYIDILKQINNTNSCMKKMFTDDIFNDEKYILNNASYCVFVKNIFIKYKLKYIKINYNVKNKELYFSCNYFIENKEIIEELSKFRNFSDSLITWYNKINNILKKIKEYSKKLFNSYINYKTDDGENYFQNIDNFIESQYEPLCIHINEGIVKNIYLKNRHNRIFKKENLNIIEIFDKLEVSISTIHIPETIQECLCFWILMKYKQ